MTVYCVISIYKKETVLTSVSTSLEISYLIKLLYRAKSENVSDIYCLPSQSDTSAQC